MSKRFSGSSLQINGKKLLKPNSFGFQKSGLQDLQQQLHRIGHVETTGSQSHTAHQKSRGFCHLEIKMSGKRVLLERGLDESCFRPITGHGYIGSSLPFGLNP
ncbi:hypothetical protein CEXT_639501 [Caerostris extrusa]|uniref:Uncharacterized protein n=1 Tax=Caerostris extrusa TaxID=172846 RepID=A0AAV4QR56_CAEEX|nr:hypothetical protein CEXT_639501 [Caerostris extrusa]